MRCLHLICCCCCCSFCLSPAAPRLNSCCYKICSFQSSARCLQQLSASFGKQANTESAACVSADSKMQTCFVQRYLARQPCVEFKRVTTLLNMAPARKRLKQSKVQRGCLQTSAGPMKGLSAAAGVSPGGNKRKRNSNPGRRQLGKQPRQDSLYSHCVSRQSRCMCTGLQHKTCFKPYMISKCFVIELQFIPEACWH